MKKILIGCFCLLLLGCTIKTDAKKAASDFLNKYINLEEEVLLELDEYISNETLSEEQKGLYKEILKKQYKELKYEITNEVYEGDDAIVSAKITVYDLYKIQKKAEEYKTNNLIEFYDETNNYDQTIFLDYKLNQMKNNTNKIEYTIDFLVSKIDSVWVVSQPSNKVLEKIHGIYNYDNK